MSISASWIPLGLLIFWAAYFTIVLVMNACDALKAFGLLPQKWKFASGNYHLIRKATQTYRAPAWLDRVLFLSVIAWQTLAAVLLWLAVDGWPGLPAVDTALAVGIALFAAFILVDEIFKEYKSENDHMLIFAAQLLTLLAIHVLLG